MPNLSTLSHRARRVLATLNEIAGGTDEADASWMVLHHKTGYSRKTIAGAICELKSAGIIQRASEVGLSARYTMLSRAGQRSHSAPEEPPSKKNEGNCTGVYQCTPVYTSARFASESDSESDDDDDTTNQKRSKIAKLLSEYLVEDPIKTLLADQLVPIIDHEAEIVAICERTKHEIIWKNKPGVIVRRLRAFAEGKQDPLPVFASIMDATAPAAGRGNRPRGSARKTAPRVTLRPQVAESSDTERDAARERARISIAERAARKAAEGMKT